MAATDVEITRAENKTLELTVRNKDDVIFNLTGHTLTFTVKSSSAEIANLILKTSASASEINLVDPVNGRADIILVPGDTVNIEPGDYEYDVWVTLNTGEDFTVIKLSSFKITARVTVL